MTGAALRMTWHHFFVAGEYFRRVGCKNRKTQWYEAVSSALNFPFLKEVSQNCFVFYVVKFKKVPHNCFVCDVVNLEKSGGLAELLRFWRRSRRIASFLMLSTSKRKEVSQKCCVF